MTLDLSQLSGDLELTHWRFEAACAGEDDRLFFPSRGSSTKVARAICSLCPVKQECLDHAIENKENAGIWGGMSVRERRLEAQKRGRSFPERETYTDDIKDLIKEDLEVAEALLKGG